MDVGVCQELLDDGFANLMIESVALALDDHPLDPERMLDVG